MVARYVPVSTITSIRATATMRQKSSRQRSCPLKGSPRLIDFGVRIGSGLASGNINLTTNGHLGRNESRTSAARPRVKPVAESGPYPHSCRSWCMSLRPSCVTRHMAGTGPALVYSLTFNRPLSQKQLYCGSRGPVVRDGPASHPAQLDRRWSQTVLRDSRHRRRSAAKW